MNYAVLGTGGVGQTLATKLVELGHAVVMGSRTARNEAGARWAAEKGGRIGTFADAAAFGEVIINATSGGASIAALEAAGEKNLAGKVLIDVANPLDVSQGMPPRLSVSNGDSLGEQIQRRFPEARVVKTLNTVSSILMTAPDGSPRPHNLFLSGDDPAAKGQVREMLRSFGWTDAEVLDLGGIQTARGPEMYLPLWLGIAGTSGNWTTTIRVVNGP